VPGVIGVGWPALLRSPYRVEELADFELEALAVTGQRLRRGEHLRRSRSGPLAPRCTSVNVGGNLLGAVGGLLHVAEISWVAAPCSSTAAAMVDEISDNFSMVPADFLDGVDRLLGRGLDSADLLTISPVAFAGFAVVASEVKALASRREATGEIGQQISGIQAATQESVNAIKEISGTIEKLSEISSTIAAAVEEQGAATRRFPATCSRPPTAPSRFPPTSPTCSAAPARPDRFVAGALRGAIAVR